MTKRRKLILYCLVLVGLTCVPQSGVPIVKPTLSRHHGYGWLIYYGNHYTAHWETTGAEG